MNNRMVVLLGVLVVLLVGLLWYFLLWTPNQDEITDLRAQTRNERQLADDARARAAQLREVRAQAPELEAALGTAAQLVPVELGLPAILRQVQSAAEDAGVTLQNLAPSPPEAAGSEELPFDAVELSFNVEGTYFQLVDLARRLEDPALMGRGLTWRFGTFGIAEEFPSLSGSLAATVYARSSEPGAEEQAADAADQAEARPPSDDEPSTEPGSGDEPPPRPDGDEQEPVS